MKDIFIFSNFQKLLAQKWEKKTLKSPILFKVARFYGTRSKKEKKSILYQPFNTLCWRQSQFLSSIFISGQLF